MRRIVITTLLLVALFMGCTKVRFGRMPNTQALHSRLTQHVSTKADVLRVLGPPRGYGMARLPNLPRSVLWFYEFMESDGNNVDLKMLLIFFYGEKYGGHFWFSSFEKIEVIR